MLTLRFQRQGKKRDFIFRIIAVDSKTAVNSGKSKEILGWWDPRINKFELKKERILYWISQGAQPSDSCYNLLVRAKIIEGKKRSITIRKKKVKEEKTETGEKTKQASATEEKVEEKAVEETKDEVKPEEKAEEKSEEKVEEKKEEVKEEIKEEQKTGEVKAEVKEGAKEDIKEKAEKEKTLGQKTEK
ncbi:30S ribosomal protein S16 [bacterium]|nr:30S ribosomal protein S16 [bacterium]